MVPIGADTFPEGLRMGVEVFHALKKVLTKHGPLHRGGRRRRLRADAAVQRGGARRDHVRRSSARATSRARTSRSRSTSPRRELYRGRRVRLQEGRQVTPQPPTRWWRSTPDWVDRYPDRLDRGRPGGGRLGRAGRSSPSGWATGCSWWATTSSSPTSSGWRAGSRRASANAILIKVNQIGTLTETLQCIELAKGERVRRRHLPPLGRDRGHLHRRPRGGDRRGADQDRQRLAHRPHRQVQPAAPDRRGAGRRWPTIPAGTSTPCDPRCAWAGGGGARVRAVLRGAGRGVRYDRPARAPARGGGRRSRRVARLERVVDSLAARRRRCSRTRGRRSGWPGRRSG